MVTQAAFQPFILRSKHLKPYLLRSLSTAEKSNYMKIVGGDGTGRVVVLGTGWAGFNLARKMNSDNSPELRVVSPSNHFVFTPLLPSTAVGTLEFRCIQAS